MRTLFAAAVACLTIVGLSYAGDSQAAIRKTFNIPAQGLGAALQTLSKEQDVQIVFMLEDVDHLSTQGVSGEMTVNEALGQLLEGTGLRYEYVDQETVTIVPVAPVTRGSSPIVGRDAGSAFYGREKSSQAGGELNSSPRERRGVGRLAQSEGDDNNKGMQRAQDTNSSDSAKAEDENKLQEIVVSGSRLARPDVPTALLTVGSDVLQEASRPNIVAALNDLPQFKASSVGQTTGGGNPGVYTTDLRSLTAVRTLNLIDGRRFAGDYVTPDSAIVPSIMVDHVDIVTGGASAAWGSNAVAGVVNIGINDKLEGVRLGAKGSISSRDDVGEQAFEAAFGTGFADERGHFVIGGEYVDNEGGGPRTDRKNVGRWVIVNNVFTPDVGDARLAPGGIIRSGVNAGRAFNPDGTLYQFNLGTVVGNNAIGGDSSSNDDVTKFYAPSKRFSALARIKYELTDDLSATTTLNAARISGGYPFFGERDFTLTISRDNAFLPAAIQAQMDATGETSFTMGRYNDDYATLQNDYERTLLQATLQLDGKLGSRMAWQAYYTNGSFRANEDISNSRISANFALALDAVVNPATGLPVCRVALTNPASDCVPINIFGVGAPSQGARDYVLGTSMAHNLNKLHAGGISLRGDPVDLWAGPVSFAIGAETRRESLDNDNGPLDGTFTLVNAPKFKGANTTKEAFAEVQLPIIRDVPLLNLLQVNGAGRFIEDTSGSIWAWKGGLVNEVTQGVQIRATRSHDIRAPNLNELFALRTGPSILRVLDPATGNSPQIFSFSGGNPALNPETASTTTAGITFAPRTIPTLNLSVDYFAIKVKNAISSLAAQDVVNGCFAGNQGLCAAVARDAGGTILTVDAALQNFQSFNTNGFDFALGYIFPFDLGGTLSARANVTWTRKFERDSGLATVSFLGSQGTQTGGIPGIPKVRGTAALYYESGNFGADVRARYISAGAHNKALTTLVDNHIPAYVYVDLGVKFTIPTRSGTEFELFGNVSNLFDKDPPVGTQFTAYYDIVGRYYTGGVRLRF